MLRPVHYFFSSRNPSRGRGPDPSPLLLLTGLHATTLSSSFCRAWCMIKGGTGVMGFLLRNRKFQVWARTTVSIVFSGGVMMNVPAGSHDYVLESDDQCHTYIDMRYVVII